MTQTFVAQRELIWGLEARLPNSLAVPKEAKYA